MNADSKVIKSSRRDWLKMMGLAGAALAGAGMLPATDAPRTKKTAWRSARLAHISDVHLQPELRADAGFIKCLHHIQSQRDKPRLILNTGDCIMDALEAKSERTTLQWDLWKKILRDECSIPFEHAIGNHDCWGWHKIRSGTTGDEALWGKKWALDVLGLPKTYRSFDYKGWHFIMLDSIEPFQDTYKARLGAEQLAWLTQDLAAVPRKTPIIVASHIPIISPAAVALASSVDTQSNISIPGGLMHLDSKEIHTALKQHGNVKLCLSGHLHIVDRAEYDGITYVSSGAVSANWWKGLRLERYDYGYALVDLYEDGSFNYQYVPYGWKTYAAPTAEIDEMTELTTL
jgi:Icc protein